MEKVIIILFLSLSGFVKAQGSYDQEMAQAFQLWEEGQYNEASALFDHLSQTESNNWLPNYYVALVNTSEAFKIRDPNKINALLKKAQTALKKEMVKDSLNVELLVMQAMIHTARIASDPMSNGQSLTPEILQLFKKAEIINPNNPRLVFSQAQFEMGKAQFFGTDLQLICKRIEKSIKLFDNFKPASSFHPNWGKQQALESLNNCK